MKPRIVIIEDDGMQDTHKPEVSGGLLPPFSSEPLVWVIHVPKGSFVMWDA